MPMVNVDYGYLQNLGLVTGFRLGIGLRLEIRLEFDFVDYIM